MVDVTNSYSRDYIGYCQLLIYTPQSLCLAGVFFPTRVRLETTKGKSVHSELNDLFFVRSLKSIAYDTLILRICRQRAIQHSKQSPIFVLLLPRYVCAFDRKGQG